MPIGQFGATDGSGHVQVALASAGPPSLYRVVAAACWWHRCDPTLPLADMGEAVRFCEAAGFDVRRYDDGFAFVYLNDQSVFDLDLIDGMVPETNHAGCYITTNDVDEWHRRLVAADLKVTSIEDMPWGMHEFSLTDPSGNNIRIGCNQSND